MTVSRHVLTTAQGGVSSGRVHRREEPGQWPLIRGAGMVLFSADLTTSSLEAVSRPGRSVKSAVTSTAMLVSAAAARTSFMATAPDMRSVDPEHQPLADRPVSESHPPTHDPEASP